MSTPLIARALSRQQTLQGIEAQILVIEPNGDEYQFSCTCRGEGTEIGGDGDSLAYLNERYGDVVFCTAVRRAALAEPL